MGFEPESILINDAGEIILLVGYLILMYQINQKYLGFRFDLVYQ